MLSPLIASSRRFQVWLFTASHSQLLLRANPTDTEPERIEVLFKAVTWMALPTQLTGLRIVEVQSDDLTRLLKEFSAPFDELPGPYSRCFELSGTDYRGAVVAANAVVSQDNLSYDAPSAFHEQNLSVGIHLHP